MNAPPDAQRVARRWIAKADEDLAAAERLLAIDDSLASVVCFHSQHKASGRRAPRRPPRVLFGLRRPAPAAPLWRDTDTSAYGWPPCLRTPVVSNPEAPAL
jgi:hypothetical protein